MSSETAWVLVEPDEDSKRHADRDCIAIENSAVEERPVDDVDLDRCAQCHEDKIIAASGSARKALWDMDADEVGRTNPEGSA